MFSVFLPDLDLGSKAARGRPLARRSYSPGLAQPNAECGYSWFAFTSHLGAAWTPFALPLDVTVHGAIPTLQNARQRNILVSA